MINKIANTILIMCLLLPSNSNAGNTKKDSALQIYLPREITIKDKHFIRADFSTRAEDCY
ncbi:MAG: hypothetical protein ACYS6K_11570 [Planctomycetota bacterium]